MRKGLSRYSKPLDRVKKMQEYNKKHYKQFLLTLSYERDSDMIKQLTSCPNKTEEVRKWYKLYKKKGD